MKKIITYNFYKEVDGMNVYKELLGDKYTIEFKENGKIINIHFYFDITITFVVCHILIYIINY